MLSMIVEGDTRAETTTKGVQYACHHPMTKVLCTQSHRPASTNNIPTIIPNTLNAPVQYKHTLSLQCQCYSKCSH